jgi:hypothetical protein
MSLEFLDGGNDVVEMIGMFGVSVFIRWGGGRILEIVGVG